MFIKYYQLLLVATFIVNSQQDESKGQTIKRDMSGNEIFDIILSLIKSNDRGLETFYKAVPVHSLVKQLEFEVMIRGLRVNVSLEATDGKLSDLTSMRRISDVTNRTDGNRKFYMTHVALDDLQVVFNKYTLRTGIFDKTGDKLDFRVRKNSFFAILKYNPDGQGCQLSLENLTMSELSDVHVDISGFSIFSFVGETIVSWFKDYFYELISHYSGMIGKDMVKYVLKNIANCETTDHNPTLTTSKEVLNITTSAGLPKSTTVPTTTTTEDDYLIFPPIDNPDLKSSNVTLLKDHHSSGKQ